MNSPFTLHPLPPTQGSPLGIDPLRGVDDLHEVLLGEVDACRQLVALAQRERVALHNADLAELAVTTREKQAIGISLARWEEMRERIVTHLLRELALPATGGSASLPDLVASLQNRLGKEQHAIADKLIALREDCRGLVEQLLTLNLGNRLVIQTELARVDATFDYLAQTMAPSGNRYVPSPARRDASPPPGAGDYRPAERDYRSILNWQV